MAVIGTIPEEHFPSGFPLAGFDPRALGLLRVDTAGFILESWGLPATAADLHAGDLITDTVFANCYLNALQGLPRPELVGPWRCHAALKDHDVWLLVVEADEEEVLRRRCRQNERSSAVLSRFSRALAINNSVRSLALAALPVLASSLNLHGGLLWLKSEEGGYLELVDSVGVDRIAWSALDPLDAENGLPCAARLAASQAQSLFLHSVEQSPLTAELEGRLTRHQAGGLFAAPLMSGGQLLGTIELLSKAEDPQFAESREIMNLAVDLLSHRLHGAWMFEQAEKLAAYDPLTGIPNHRTLQQFLRSRVAECRRLEQPLGVIMLDVDNFRSFNELHGHDAGDQVLRMVAGALRSSLRGYDLAARYGGEEFTLVLPGVGPELTLQAAERIRQSVSELLFVDSHGHECQITASLGCAVLSSELCEPGQILKAADLALYAAKRAGRNRSMLFDDEMKLEAARTAPIDVAQVRGLIPHASMVECESLLKKVKPFLGPMSQRLKFGRRDRDLIEAAVLLSPIWSRALTHERERLSRELIQRRLEPVLTTLESSQGRFDRLGQDQDLRGRALAVALAAAGHGCLMLTDDPGRFDPELAAIAAQVLAAA